MRVIIDIDDTLWNFGSVWYEFLKEHNNDIPTPKKWDTWWTGLDYVDKSVMHETAKKVHSQQDNFDIFEKAAKFVNFFKQNGFTVEIASQRCHTTYEATVRWLNKHEIYYDKLHCISDKSVLFDEKSILIDDSPEWIDRAHEKGMKCYGLKYQYNQHLSNKAILFDSFEDMYQHFVS